MAGLETILAKLVSDNQQSRERFGGIASRTVSAVMTGNTNELNIIIRDVTDSKSSDEISSEPMEAGSTDGAAGDKSTAESSG
jgi:hypothetical protein